MHMREFNDPSSKTYGQLKRTPREAEFVNSLVQAVRDSAIPASVATSVLMPELERFNIDHDTTLDGYSVAIYVCLIMIRRIYRTEPVQIIVDGFDKSISRAAAAKRYASSDITQLNATNLTIIPPEDKKTWRDIPPLQVADCMAWEVRKFRNERAHFKIDASIKDDIDLINLSYHQWAKQNRPRDRLSFQALRKSTIYRPMHVVMDEHRFDEISERHPLGWGD